MINWIVFPEPSSVEEVSKASTERWGDAINSIDPIRMLADRYFSLPYARREMVDQFVFDQCVEHEDEL